MSRSNIPLPSPAKRAFTLIELLVVIAIIAILASLLLPALSKAKQKSIQTQCTGNQKQLMLATVMYYTDNNDYLPHPNWDFITSYAGWLCRPPFELPQTNMQSGLLWTYLGNYEVFRCPADKTNNPTFRQRRQKYSSYIMNGAACFFQVQQRPETAKAGGLRQDAILLWQADERLPGDYNDGSSSASENITRVHNQGTTVGTVSGSVEYIKVRAFTVEAQRRPGRLWWNPRSRTGD